MVFSILLDIDHFDLGGYHVSGRL